MKLFICALPFSSLANSRSASSASKPTPVAMLLRESLYSTNGSFINPDFKQVIIF